MTETKLSFAGLVEEDTRNAYELIKQMINKLVDQPLSDLYLKSITKNENVLSTIRDFIEYIPYLELVDDDKYIRFTYEFLYNTNQGILPSEVFFYGSDINKDHLLPNIDMIKTRIDLEADSHVDQEEFDALIQKNIVSINRESKYARSEFDVSKPEIFDNNYALFNYVMAQKNMHVDLINTMLIISIY